MSNKNTYRVIGFAGCVLVFASLGYSQLIDPIKLTMDEVSTQPINGLTLKGVKFTDTTGATINTPNGGLQADTQDPVIEGITSGETVTMTFAQPVSSLGFGVSLSTNAALTPGFTVTLFDTAGNQIGSPIPINTAPVGGDTFTEGLFRYSGGIAVKSATVTFNSGGAAAFGLDNVTLGFNSFQMTYVSNLSVGDSVINITNAGTSGAALPSGTTATITGAVCANVYAFTPDEQLVSCCSCPVTPNGLVSLSAKNDLASNTLTPAVPTALVVKLVASVPVSGSCTNSAGALTTATLAPGMLAFASTIHATPTSGTYGVTETPFRIASLSTGEENRLGSLCNFILANGSGFGVCRSCRLGGLGATRQ